MSLLNWAEIIGGVVGAPFTGGASLALVGPGIQGLASEKAANTQTKALQQAGATVQAGTNQARQDILNAQTAGVNALQQAGRQQQALYAPFTSLGAGAAGALGFGMGVPSAPATGGQPFGTLAPVGPSRVMSGSVTGGPVSSVPASGGTVTLKAPDGTIQAVPAAQAAYYLAKGAERVS